MCDTRTWVCRQCGLQFTGSAPTGWDGYCSACQPVLERPAPAGQPEAEPTCNAPDNPPPAVQPHDCPYGGVVEERPAWPYSATLDGPIYGPMAYATWPCGRAGRLCDRCREDRADDRAMADRIARDNMEQDRADARTRALVRALLSHNKGLESTDAILGPEGLL